MVPRSIFRFHISSIFTKLQEGFDVKTAFFPFSAVLFLHLVFEQGCVVIASAHLFNAFCLFYLMTIFFLQSQNIECVLIPFVNM